MPRFASNEPTAISMAGVVFGRCFEKALGAYFEHQDCTAALFKEWEAFRDTPFEYWRENPGICSFIKESTF